MSLSRIPRKTERRRNSRKPLGGTVPILCQDEDGHESRYQARLMDISASGARLWVPAKLAARSLVSFNSPELHVGGRGTVRYCNPAKGGYEVGLEMGNGTGWRDQSTDLSNLAAALEESRATPQSSEIVTSLIHKKP